ncbi:DUF3911 family protein, partial [Bacillus sp. SS-TM]
KLLQSIILAVQYTVSFTSSSAQDTLLNDQFVSQMLTGVYND